MEEGRKDFQECRHALTRKREREGALRGQIWYDYFTEALKSICDICGAASAFKGMTLSAHAAFPPFIPRVKRATGEPHQTKSSFSALGE